MMSSMLIELRTIELLLLLLTLLLPDNRKVVLF